LPSTSRSASSTHCITRVGSASRCPRAFTGSMSRAAQPR
jgi:hypothetical protein